MIVYKENLQVSKDLIPKILCQTAELVDSNILPNVTDAKPSWMKVEAVLELFLNILATICILRLVLSFFSTHIVG
jgi:hypothetical protein